jgi:hypothetical protein
MSSAWNEPNPDAFSVQALVVSHAVPLRVARLDGDRVPDGLPDGLLALGLFVGNHLISRLAVTPGDEEMLSSAGLFEEPRRLILYGMAHPPGVQARLTVLIPESLLPSADDAKPWESASQSYERNAADDALPPDNPLAEVLDGVRQLPVGDLVRYDAMRKFPDDLAAELADMIGNALQRGAQDIVDHALAALDRQLGEDDPPEG